jgi:signal transduction histidine kinase
VIGYVIIDLDLKKQTNETVNSELVQPVFDKERTSEYAHAVYINDKLITQTNDYPFTDYLKDDTLHEQHYSFYNNKNVSELYYKIADNRTIVVVHYHSEILELITLFSYLFGIQVLLAVVILLYQLYLSYFTGTVSSAKFIRLTLRKRVHFSMLAVILISFIIIGSVTILFFTIQYKTSNKNKLQSVMQVAKQSVQDYLNKYHAYDSDHIFDSVSRSGSFKFFITELANGQKTDINIYDDNGILFNTSEDDIYNKGLLSNRIRPDAFFQLNNLGKSIAIQDETVAGLSYLAAYQPLRDEHGVTLGYINVPMFSSERDLKFQISNIVVTLINVYAFIFLISSIITVAITRWITRTFDIISKQFGQLNLQRNERINWPYEDEIGDLVKEYNKMVNKVEENAILLAQSERESAWREMARQVAHEIKNPLTPMKLNIQYLQQAMLKDDPNIKELTGKVSDSIIEQIDNLSYIASEFSNFAKMPEARPEELELGELLNKAIELYLNDPHIKVTVEKIPEKLHVFSDRSQLLRVFTNLLENAKQAIPSETPGNIDVSLKADNGKAIIAITDNGQGIPEDIVKRVFQPYFTTKSSGTGLGLAMTRKIIEFWKGEIWFETREGEGTTFYIRLPLIPQTPKGA